MIRGDLKKVPAWPVIALTFDGDTAVADPAGIGDPIRVAAYPDLATAAASAAVSAARRLEVRRCRVQGVSPDGDVWMMVVDVDTERLTDLDARPATSPTAAGPLRSRLSIVPRRWWLVIGTAAVAAVALAVVLVPRSLLPAVNDADTAVVEEAPVPPAGQLPVSAPAGWNTYAGWVVDSAGPGAAAVLAGKDTLVLVDGAEVIGVDAKTGQERWRGGVTADVSALYAPAGGDVVYAAESNTGVSVLDTETGEVLSEAGTTAQEITLADVPFAQLPGQAGAVLVDGAWQRRQVPATSVPVGTVGEGLVNVSLERQRVWVTTSNDPALPEAAKVKAPGKGLSISRVVALVDGRLILEWSGKLGAEIFTVDNVSDAGKLERAYTFDATTGSSGQTSVDAVNGLVGIGSLLLDVESQTISEDKGGAIVAQSGYGWSSQSGAGRVRIAPDGETMPLAPSAALPDVILPDGRAVVRAARGAEGEAYYALEVEQPTPAPTPKPTEGKGK